MSSKLFSCAAGSLPPGTATRLTTGMAGNRPGTRGGQVGGGVGMIEFDLCCYAHHGVIS